MLKIKKTITQEPKQKTEKKHVLRLEPRQQPRPQKRLRNIEKDLPDYEHWEKDELL